MRVHYASDVHLEFYEDTSRIVALFKGDSEGVLVLAGDIGNPYHDSFEHFINTCCERYKHVVYVAGNHEYYNHKGIDATNEKITKAKPSNFHFLNNSAVTLDGVNFVGCTLHTYFPESKYKEATDYMRDFKYMKPELYVERNKQSTEYLRSYLESSKDKTVVVTHHLPSFDAIALRYKFEPGNYLFANHLDVLVRQSCVSAWICGHTHIGGIYGKIHINPFGYPDEGHPKNTSLLEL